MSITAPPASDRRTAPNTVAIISSVVSLMLLVGLVCSKVVGPAGLGELCILFFGFFGLGSAPLQMLPNLRGFRFFITSIGLSVSIVLLTGCLLVELHLWKIATPLFFTFAITAAMFHVWGLIRNLPVLMHSRIRVKQNRFSIQRFLILIALAVGFALSLGSAINHENLSPKLGGLPTSIGFVWFVGLALLVLSIVMSWLYSDRLMSVSVVAFIALVTLTPSIVYGLPRDSWTQGQVGLTQYFLQHGTVNTHLNIYDSWPGFFSGIAWLCRAGGFSGIEQIARWWSPAVDLTGAVIIVFLAKIVGASNRNAWLAGLLFVIGNAVGQDYYSPQSVALVTFLLIIAVSLRPIGESIAFVKCERLDWVLVVLLSAAVAVSHPLTPFVVSGMLIILAIFGLLKSRWMSLVPLICAVTWTSLHLKVVEENFNIRAIGNIFANVQTPTSGLGFHYGLFGYLGVVGQVVAAVAIGVLALVALLSLRDRMSFGLGVCAASAGLLVILVHYGNEDLFRATLFALPLLVITASRFEWRNSKVRSALLVGMIPIVAVAYVFGDTAFDYVNVVQATDLSVIRNFYETAPSGSKLIVIGPSAYFLESPIGRAFSFTRKFYDLPGMKGGPKEEARKLTKMEEELALRAYKNLGVVPNIYLITYEEASVVWVDGGVYSANNYREFAQTLASSSYWNIVSLSPTATLLKFRSNYFTNGFSSGAG